MNALKFVRELIKNDKPLTTGILTRISGGKAIISTSEGTKVVNISTNEIRLGVQVDLDNNLVTRRNKTDSRIVSHQL